jgi:flagellar P-ring protein precursor FlgI
LRREKISFEPGDLGTGSVSLVVVTAKLGPWDRVGSLIDVDVAAVSDTKSLTGGILLETELKGLDGQVYAVAKGALSTASWNVSGNAASAIKNHPTVARIPNGANVERQEIADFVQMIDGFQCITLNLRNSDFTTAERIRNVIESQYLNSVFVEDAGTVRVRVPHTISRLDMVSFVDKITSFEVQVDSPAVVVINERTGTIIVGEKVAISPVGISQGALVISVKEIENVSQPSPFSDVGQTAITQDTGLDIREETGSLIPVPKVVTVSELAKALNRIGATPRDLIAIFNGLKEMGALQAELRIM